MSDNLELNASQKAVFEYLYEQYEKAQAVTSNKAAELNNFLSKAAADLKIDITQYSFNTDALVFQRKEEPVSQ